MTPREYVQIEKQERRVIAACERRIAAAYRSAKGAPLPDRTRLAKASDIRVGAVIWYPERVFVAGAYTSVRSVFWNVVREVLSPGDRFKAYVADDGCRYGLDGAEVEKRSVKRGWGLRAMQGRAVG